MASTNDLNAQFPTFHSKYYHHKYNQHLNIINGKFRFWTKSLKPCHNYRVSWLVLGIGQVFNRHTWLGATVSHAIVTASKSLDSSF